MKKRLELRNKKLNEEEGKLEVWHSVFYHRHFDGYAEYYEPGERKPKLCRMYVAEYYSQKLPRYQSLLLRLFFACLFAGGLYACVYGACIPVASNGIWYVNLPQAFTLPCAFYGVLTLVSYVCMPTRMERKNYRFAVLGLRRATLLTGFCCLLSAAATTVSLLLSGGQYASQSWKCALLFLIAGMQMLLISLIERRISYEKIKNEAIPPQGSVVL